MNIKGKLINNKYKVIKKIGEGGISSVWLSKEIKSNKYTAIKILKQNVISNRLEDLIRFRNEAQIISKLNFKNILKIYEFGEENDFNYIVMEFINGKSLLEILNDIKKNKLILSVNDLIHIMYKIIEAIKNVHNIGIIHRDLKPSNIMIYYPESQEIKTDKYNIKIIDFGLASIKEYFEIKDKKEISGTFSYMSPEQIGVIKKEIDERSDLYSLGIIFYQLLTKELPFYSDNISTIIHSHASKIPASLRKINQNIPYVLEKIILKLLEKEPEKRYQSTEGLLNDLKKIKEGLLDFDLGLEDDAVKLNFKTSIIGRDEELNNLKNYFNDSSMLKGSICLIGGTAGTGKTRLVDEFKNYVYLNNGIFIDGKCFSGENKIPYGPFKDALNVYLKKFNMYPNEKKIEIKKNIKGFIGDLGRLVLKLNPLFKEIIGECPPLVKLESERENKRFLIQISNFFYNLAKLEKTIVLFIDDMQWMDDGSFTLLNEITKNILNSSLFIIGTYRNNEITKTHNIINLINTTKQNKYPLNIIDLNAFNKNQMDKFISSLLYNKDKKTLKISDFIFKKSKGNPFFTIEILKQLVYDKAIIYKNQKWDLNNDILEKIEIPPTIIDIVSKRILLLNEDEINVLSYAAVIGKKFHINFLFELCNRWTNVKLTDNDVVKIVDKAINLQLLEEDFQEKGKILFVHDRIKDAFYKNIGNKERKKLHLDIADKLEKMNSKNIENIIFDLINHYIEGNNKDKILKYIYIAAVKAQENYAYNNAIKYLKIGISKLKNNTDDWIKLNTLLGEIYLIIGKFNEAIKIFNMLLPLIKSNNEKAKIYRNICDSYFKKGDFATSEKYGYEGLKLLGLKLPITKKSIILSIIKELIIHFISFIFYKRNLKHSNTKINEKYLTILSFSLTLGWMYTLDGSLKFINIFLYNLNISLIHIGKSKILGFSLSGYASLLMGLTLFKTSLKYHKLGLKIIKSVKDEWCIAQSYQLFGYYFLFMGKYAKSIMFFKKSYSKFENIGDIWEMAMCLSGMHHTYQCLSDYKNTQKCLNDFLHYSELIKNDYYIEMYKVMQSLRYIDTGQYNEAEILLKKSLISTKKNNIPFLHCIILSYYGYYFLEKNDFNKSVIYLEKAKKINEENIFLILYTVNIYPYLADAYIENYKKMYRKYSINQKNKELKKIKKACFKALSKTKLWNTNHVISLRVTAKYYSLIKNNKKAEKYFDRSIALCEKLGRKYELAKGYYDYGRHFNKKNIKLKAEDCWSKSYKIFKEIGANVCMKKAADLLGLKEKISFSKRLMDKQRLESVIGISQDLCSIMNITELLNHIMQKAVEVTGAQRGYLFIKNEETGELQLKAPENTLLSDIPTYSKNIVREVSNKGEYILTTNAEKDERYIKYKSIIDYGLKSILCIPMKYQRKIIGVCYLDNPISSFVFTEEDADILNVFIAQAAIAIENASLYQKEKIQQQKLYQADKLITLGTIVSGVAHEINNPINNIMINSNLLQKSYQYIIPILDDYYNEKGDFILGSNKYSEIKENFNNLFNGIINGSHRIKKITEDLKNFSKKIPDLYFESININNVVESAIALIYNKIKNSTDHFSIMYGKNLPNITGNFQRLEQAVVNLIQNSCQALRSKKDSIIISTYMENDKDELIIETKDEGIGMNEETVKNILKPFFTTKSDTGGIGLGLYITSNIIKEHKGRLEYNSALNKGTTAKIILPIKDNKNSMEDYK